MTLVFLVRALVMTLVLFVRVGLLYYYQSKLASLNPSINNTYSLYYRYETLYITQIYHPESNSQQSALHIWVILLKPDRYCDMEVEHLKLNILYMFFSAFEIEALTNHL